MRFVRKFGILALLLAGCGNSDTSSTGGPATDTSTGPISAADFPARYLDAFCAALAPCCSAESVTYDDVYCREHAAFDPGKYGELVSSPAIAFDPAAAGRCLDAIKATCSLKDDLQIPGCEGVIVGKTALGGACFDSITCAPVTGQTVRCGGQKEEDGPGTCRLPVVLAAGEACGGQIDGGCADELTCDASGHCAALPGVGQPCSDQFSCARTAYCDATKVCVAKPGAGEVCTGDGTCLDGLYCNTSATPPTCGARLKHGEACKTGVYCLSGRCERGLCRDAELRSCSKEPQDDSSTPSP